MSHSPLDAAITALGPVPAAFRFSIDAAYAHLRNLIRSSEGFAQYSLRSYRSVVHDHAWVVARQVLSEIPECRFVHDSGTEIMRYEEKFAFQIHKVDDLLRISDNGTMRPLEIQGQGHLWQVGASPHDGVVWLTIGHKPNAFTHVPENIIVGVALEGGMTEFRQIDPAADVVASIGPQASETVRRLREAGGMGA